MSSITTRRALTYWLLFFAFLMVGGPIYNYSGTFSPVLHDWLDRSSLIFAAFATLLVWRAYRQTRATVLSITAITLAATTMLELLHVLAGTPWLTSLIAADPAHFRDWSWHATRVILGLGLLAAACHASRDNFGTKATVGTRHFPRPALVAVLAVAGVAASVYALVVVELPSIYYQTFGLLRFPEIISGTIFVAAIQFFTRKGNWRTDSYTHWINLALVLNINAQYFCMAFSQTPFDASFMAAHVLKLAAFALLALGFLARHKATAAADDLDAHKPRGLGLGVKVALLCGFIGFICVIPVAIKSSQTLHEIAGTNAMQSLATAAANTSSALEKQRSRVDADLDYLAGTGLVEAFYRAQEEGGIDTLTSRSRDELLSDMNRLARNLMISDSSYLSLIYVDAASGQAIVSGEQNLDRGERGINTRRLRESENRLAERATQASRAQPLVRTNVFLLGDDSVRNGHHLPVEGAARAIYARDTGALLGSYIVHSDISRALESGSQLASADTRMYVINRAGEFLLHPDPMREVSPTGLSWTASDEFPGVEFSALRNDVPGERYVDATGVESLAGFYRQESSPDGREPLLYVYAGSREVLEQMASVVGYELQRIAQANLLIAIVIGWLFARRFAKPVKELSVVAAEFGRSGKIGELPVVKRDEIGLLGQSIGQMMTEVASQREKLGLLAAAVESSVNSTLISNNDGYIEYVNPHYELYSGIPAAELLGTKVIQLPEFQQHRHILNKEPSRKGNERVWTGQMTMQRADGRLHHEQVTISPIRNAAGEIINHSCVIEDITERREMEERIEKNTAELQRSNRDLEQFAYVASHDLKAPLRAIEVLVGWLKDDLEDYQEGDVQENLDLLRQRTNRLSRLLDDLLAYSRAGRKIGDVRTIDTQEFVEDIVALISPPDGFVIETVGDMPTLHTYHAPLETVFRNLINNAIKHSPDPATGRVRIYAEDRGDQVEFAVEDNGTGIPAEYAEKVFKMFQTLKARDEKEGSGMGLAIVQRIIDWQGGKIWFTDGPDGQGAVFRFTWNKQLAEMPDALPEESAAAAAARAVEPLLAAPPVESQDTESDDPDFDQEMTFTQTLRKEDLIDTEN